MNKRIQRLFPLGIKAVEEFLVVKKDSNEVPDVYFGYIAQLGAVIQTSGLLPAIGFYTDVHKDKNNSLSKEPRRYMVLKALLYIIDHQVDNEESRALLDYLLDQLYSEEQLQSNVLPKPNPTILAELKLKVLDATVALKLALRSFHKLPTPQK